MTTGDGLATSPEAVSVTVIVAVPLPTAVTSPAALTVATVESEDWKLSFAGASSGVALLL